MRKILLYLCAFACLTACKNDDDEWVPSEKSSRTVMIYMAGENNLTYTSGTRFLREDLKEIIKGSASLADNQRLLVFVDSMITDTSRAGKPYILEVHGGESFVRYQFDQDFYSCDPAYFRKVLQWMTTNAQADSYGLVLWGHAYGWVISSDTIAQSRTATRAYGEDDGSDVKGKNVKWMNITQMAKALEGLPKMKYIFADCCNMMCAEVGYELRNATDYLVGSPAEIPGDGAPYDQIIPYLYKDGSEMYRGIIDKYYDYYYEDFKTEYDLKGYSLPLAVIDTKYMESLAKETHDLLSTFTPNIPESINRDSVVFYWYYDAPIMYDMKAIMKKNATEDNYQNWLRYYDQAVPYSRMSMKWMTIYDHLEYSFKSFKEDDSAYGCVSMYLPVNSYAYNYGVFRYNLYSDKMAWNRAMEWSRFGW